MNVLCDTTVTVTDYLKDPIILCDRPDQYAGRLRGKENDFAEAYEDARLRGDAFDAQKELRFTYDDLLTDWLGRPVLALTDMQTTLGQLMPSELIGFGSKTPMPYQSRLEPLRDDIASWKELGCAIILLTGGEARGRRLQKALEEMGVPCSYADSLDGNLIVREVILLPVAYAKGLSAPGGAPMCRQRYGFIRHRLPARAQKAERGRAHRLLYRSENGRLRGARLARRGHLSGRR